MPMLRKVAQKQNRTNFPSQTERKSAWDKSMNSSAGSSALNTNWFNFPVVWSSNRFTFFIRPPNTIIKNTGMVAFRLKERFCSTVCMVFTSIRFILSISVPHFFSFVKFVETNKNEKVFS